MCWLMNNDYPGTTVLYFSTTPTLRPAVPSSHEGPSQHTGSSPLIFDYIHAQVVPRKPKVVCSRDCSFFSQDGRPFFVRQL